MISSWLWIVFTVTAAFFQTLRNAMQRELTASLGTVGATNVRFIFGFPFALLSLIGVMVVTGVPLTVKSVVGALSPTLVTVPLPVPGKV